MGQPRVDRQVLAEAAKVLAITQFGSIPMLERKLGIGFADAGHVMTALHQAGVVGPHREGRAREVLIGPEQLDATLTRLDQQDGASGDTLGQDAIDLVRSPGARTLNPEPADTVRQLTEVRSELARVNAQAGMLRASAVRLAYLSVAVLALGLAVPSRALAQPATIAAAASALALAVVMWLLPQAVSPEVRGGFLRLARRNCIRVRIAMGLLGAALISTLTATVLTITAAVLTVWC